MQAKPSGDPSPVLSHTQDVIVAFMVKGPFPTVHLHRWYKMHGMMHWKGITIYTGRDVQPFNTVTWCRRMKHFGHSLSGMLAVSELHIACAWSVVYTEIETPLTGLVSIAEVALCLQRSVETRKNFLFIHRWDGDLVEFLTLLPNFMLNLRVPICHRVFLLILHPCLFL